MDNMRGARRTPRLPGRKRRTDCKGIVSLVIRVVNHQTPKDILDAKLYFIDKIGLTEHLSPTRSNGLLAMIKQVRMYALAFQTKLEENK